MKYYYFCLLLFSPFIINAQIYIDASDRLPESGAKGPSMDVRACDIDNDGDLDIILANEFKANTILINDGKANFSNMSKQLLPQSKRDSEDVSIADFNLDGYDDLVFCSEDDIVHGRENVHEFYLGSESGKFKKSAFQLPDSEANAVIHYDINQDGFEDLIFGNNGLNFLLINKGDGTFSKDENRLPNVSKITQDLALADVDCDGDMDLFSGNEDGNMLYINKGSGFFKDETEKRLPAIENIETRKVSFGDIDNDGDPDVFLSNMASSEGKDPQNRHYLNDGTGMFRDVTRERIPQEQLHTLDAIFEDSDLDGNLDIILGNFYGGNIQILENDGKGYFKENNSKFFDQE